MGKKKENIDTSAESFRKKLKDYRMPVDPEIWNSIEKDLRIIETGKRKTLFYSVSAIAASILIAIGTALYFSGHRTHTFLPSRQLASNRIENKQNEKAEEVKTFKRGKSKSPGFLFNSKENDPHKKKRGVEKDSSLAKSRGMQVKDSARFDNVEANKDTKDTNERPARVKTEKKDDFFENTYAMAHSKEREDKKRKGTLSFSIDVGSMSASNGISNNPAAAPYLNIASSISHPSQTSQNNFGDGNGYEYDFPVSAGLYLRKGITSRWSFETGLVYTYLFFVKSGILYNSTVVRTEYGLHYLGIPLKINYDFFNNGNLSFYIGGGGMVEKSFYGREVIKQGGTSQSENLNIRQLQWSVSGNLGLNYRLIGNMGLFAEPGISYYFNDHSGIQTIRKKDPFNFTLRAGIRFTY